MAIIYSLIDNTTGEDVYVGSTTIPLKERMRVHMSPSSGLCSSILIIANMDFQVEILERCKKNVLKDREQYWMDKMVKDYKMNLVNVSRAKQNEEYTKKINQERRDKLKTQKAEYDKMRLEWIRSFSEFDKDPTNFTNMKDIEVIKDIGLI